MAADSSGPGRRLLKGWRVGCTVVSIVLVESVVCGTALVPVVLSWAWLFAWIPPTPLVQVLAVSLLAVPSYAVFALGVMVSSSLATRVTGARTPAGMDVRIADMDWRLMRWVRYMVATHVVRFIAGGLFRGSPIWTAYLRLNGARIGRRVYVNTVFVSDHNLLEFGNDVVIGGGVHLSGHTVERGVLKTGPVRLGSHVTVGTGTIVDIDVEAGPHCQIGALSLVPKHSRLDGHAVYAGVPAARIR
jgi:acetyltransferase-like isoleucine patch superfamily enzyme